MTVCNYLWVVREENKRNRSSTIIIAVHLLEGKPFGKLRCKEMAAMKLQIEEGWHSKGKRKVVRPIQSYASNWNRRQKGKAI